MTQPKYYIVTDDAIYHMLCVLDRIKLNDIKQDTVHVLLRVGVGMLGSFLMFLFIFSNMQFNPIISFNLYEGILIGCFLATGLMSLLCLFLGGRLSKKLNSKKLCLFEEFKTILENIKNN